VRLGQWQLLSTIPEHRLPRTAQCAARAEAPRHGLLDLTIGDLCKAIVSRPHEPHEDFPHDMPALDFRFEGVSRALTHQA
jgi:hypothetical protein